ncbi:MAG TPA: glycogen debranching N-terminal domain-containing protein [Acidimicrobiales bacterium]
MGNVGSIADPWTFMGASPSLGQADGHVTLVEGASFCISDRSGDIRAASAQGLFFRDTRFLSGLELKINDYPPEPLAAETSNPFSATFVLRSQTRPGAAESSLMVFRYRYVGRGMREDLVLSNYGEEAAYCSVELSFAADFANLFRVKEGLLRTDGTVELRTSASGMAFDYRKGPNTKGLRLTASQPARALSSTLHYELVIPARESWNLCLQFTPVIEGDEIEPRYLCGQPVEQATPSQRLDQWRSIVPRVETDFEDLRKVVARSAEDLGALRIFDPDHPERTVVAAGAPWFMTLFGRDSLLTSWMALLVDPDLAKGVLQTLARFQGTKVDPRQDEEPGKILHEMRFGEAPSLSLGGGDVYYGSADATPLFVMMLGELRRWGLAPEVVDSLLPAADRALSWIEDYGDKDGDGYVEYRRASDKGLANQGWKDSWNAIRFADGRLARPPIALCEVQGYVYAAYLARAHFAEEAGDTELAVDYRARANDLKVQFNRDFWLPRQGWYAMGLDCDKRPIDALASNMGHCLWTGIVDEERAPLVAERLMSPEMFSGWGIRTLATTMFGYNPISYHIGSIWPHDNALIAAGLMRYGFADEASRVIKGLLDAATHFDHGLPELFGGLSRDDVPFPVSYPSSCKPQAWAAASPLLFLRTLLRFDPWVPHGKLWVDPELPEWMGRLRIDNIPLAGQRITIGVDRAGTKIEGLPPDIEVVGMPRDPLTA